MRMPIWLDSEIGTKQRQGAGAGPDVPPHLAGSLTPTILRSLVNDRRTQLRPRPPASVLFRLIFLGPAAKRANPEFRIALGF
ncbi:MAG: hypothetical protein JO015_05090 [Verrucomicrobia bacterium]|nr:hypothetical protein [Verrucomicrobiota bacterium]